MTRYPVSRAEADEVSKLTPEETLQWLSSRLNFAILTTPTGPARDAMTEANLVLLSQMQEREVA